MRKTFLLVGALAMLSSACATTTASIKPQVTVPDRIDAGPTAPTEFEARWWRQFNDATLTALIEKALEANRDLHAAEARYRAARELAGAARLLQLPGGGVSAGAARQHLSEHEGGALTDRTFGTVHTGIDVAWEADVFGRLRGRSRASAAEAGIAGVDVRAVQVAVAAQVADAYFELRGAQREHALVESLQVRSRDLVGLTRELVSAGRVTRVDLLRAQQVDDALGIEESAARHREAQARHRLATLTASSPESLAIGAADASALAASVLPIGSVAEMLRRRPDIQAAELRIAAAAARAGVARANLFPRVEVSGSVSLIAGSLGRLSQAGAASWFVAPRIVWNIFDWPRLRREARAANHFTDAEIAGYEQAVLRAIEESRTAVDAYAAAIVQLQAAERRSVAADEAARIVSVQYREGMVDSLARISAERDAIASDVAAARALTAQRRAVVDLYRVLGGGWS